MKNLFYTLFALFTLISCGDSLKNNPVNDFLSSDNPSEINVELQNLEIDIYQKISEGDKNGALTLLKKLNHPSTDKWEEKKKKTKWYDAEEYFTYNEWWTNKRDSLREVILLMPNNNEVIDIIKENIINKNSKKINNNSQLKEKEENQNADEGSSEENIPQQPDID